MEFHQLGFEAKEGI